MPEQLYTDVAQTTVPGGVAASGTTTITVASSADFPAAVSTTDKEFQAAFVDLGTSPPTVLEYITVRNVSGTTWTIQRATSAASRFPAAARAAGVGVRAVVTATIIGKFLPRNRNPYVDVRDFGVWPTNATESGSTQDSAAGINAAMVAANLSTVENYKRDDVNGSGWTYLPGNRDFRIESILTVPQVTKVIGGNGSGTGTGSPPRIRWHGAAGGTMVEHTTPNQNIVGIHLENLVLDGRSFDGGTNAGYGSGAAKGLRYAPTSSNAAKPDTGCQCVDLWIQNCHGNAFSSESSGMTNWIWTRGRMDSVGTGFYIKASGGVFATIEKMTWDSGGVDARAQHFLFLDGEAETGNGKAYVSLDDLHLELNAVLTQSYIPTGWSPSGADTRGLIRLGVSIDAPSVVQHVLDVKHLWTPQATNKGPLSIFQITSSDLTADNRARHARAVRFTGGAHSPGMSGTSGVTEDSTTAIKLVGGVAAADNIGPFGPGQTNGSRQISTLDYHPRNDVPANEGAIGIHKGRTYIDGLNLPQSATVGAAGGGAALPATPVKYLVVYDDAGNQYKVPAFNP